MDMKTCKRVLPIYIASPCELEIHAIGSLDFLIMMNHDLTHKY